MHWFGWHVVPTPIQMPWHCDWIVCVQIVVPGRQHAPIGGHGLGVHVGPGNWFHPVGQPVALIAWHAPVTGSQHTRLHGLGTHGTPTPMNCPVQSLGIPTG